MDDTATLTSRSPPPSILPPSITTTTSTTSPDTTPNSPHPTQSQNHTQEPTLQRRLTHKRTVETLTRWVSRRIVTSAPKPQTTRTPSTPATITTANPPSARHLRSRARARALKRAEAAAEIYLEEDAYNDSGYSTPYSDSDADEEELFDSYAAFCRAFSAGHPEHRFHPQPALASHHPEGEEYVDEDAQSRVYDIRYSREEHRHQNHLPVYEEDGEYGYDYNHTQDYHGSRERFYSRFHAPRPDYDSVSQTESDSDSESHSDSDGASASSSSSPARGRRSNEKSSVAEEGTATDGIHRRPSQYLAPPVSPPARILTPTTYAQTQRAAAQDKEQQSQAGAEHHYPTAAAAGTGKSASLGRRWTRAWWGKVGCWRPR